MHSKVAIIIPVRYSSSRFVGKPIALIGSKPMVYYVYKAAKLSAYKPKVIIATDDERIFNVCVDFVENNNEIVMTPDNLNSGSERAAYVAKNLEQNYIINLQGDEPLITSALIDQLIEEFNYLDDNTPVLSFARKKYLPKNNVLFLDNNVVKLLLNKDKQAIYFSRSPIPWGKIDFFYQHVGVYGYKKQFLLDYQKMPQTYYEQLESLEQLRIIENGFRIKIKEINEDLVSVDKPEHIEIVKSLLNKKGTLL